MLISNTPFYSDRPAIHETALFTWANSVFSPTCRDNCPQFFCSTVQVAFQIILLPKGQTQKNEPSLSNQVAKLLRIRRLSGLHLKNQALYCVCPYPRKSTWVFCVCVFPPQTHLSGDIKPIRSGPDATQSLVIYLTEDTGKTFGVK